MTSAPASAPPIARPVPAGRGHHQSLSTDALEAVARRVAGNLGGWRDRAGTGTTLRSGVRLASTRDFEVWLLCWPAGSRVAPHDHGESAGAFTVLAGRLTELRWEDGLPVQTSLEPGRVVQVERGQVHDVVADDGLAYSVHVYSPPLGSMSFYDGDGCTIVRTEEYGSAPAEFIAT